MSGTYATIRFNKQPSHSKGFHFQSHLFHNLIHQEANLSSVTFKLGTGSLGNIGWKKNVGYRPFPLKAFSIKAHICNNVANLHS